MNCNRAHAAISASLDDEIDDVEERALAEHLAECPSCRRWQDAAAALTRRARTAALPNCPPELEALSRREGGRSRVAGRIKLIRLALLGVGMVQAGVAAPLLVAGPADASRDFGCVGVAIAVGFVTAAWRPARAWGLSLAAGTAALLLFTMGASSVVLAHASPLSESAHLVPVLGWLLLRNIATRFPHDGGYGPLSDWPRIAARKRAEPSMDSEPVEDIASRHDSAVREGASPTPTRRAS